MGIFDVDVLSELTDEDPSLCLMKRALSNNGYKGISGIDPYLKSFWQCSAVVDGSIVVDNRIAIPNVLQKPILARLQRSHAGQRAMVDAAQNIWWPRMHRNIMQLWKDCPQYTKFGQDIQLISAFTTVVRAE